MAKKITGTKLSSKDKAVVAKVNKILKGSSVELKSLKLGKKEKKCLEYKLIRDSKGNVTGMVCVKWG